MRMYTGSQEGKRHVLLVDNLSMMLVAGLLLVLVWTGRKHTVRRNYLLFESAQARALFKLGSMDLGMMGVHHILYQVPSESALVTCFNAE
jgi:phosphotransferase system  glucose/maltose/N-acetylglucosamine-specific IIC component